MNSRRDLLKGLGFGGGAALLSPILGQLAAEAAGTEAPQRFVFVVKSSGLTPAAVVPTELRADRVHAGEAIKAGDNYTTGLQYPGKERDGHHTIANWWMTLLHAAGAPRDVFGMADPKIAAAAQRGPLAELLV